MVRSVRSLRMRPYGLDRTEISAPALRLGAGVEAGDVLAEAAALAGRAAVLFGGDFDAAVLLPHAASARAAPIGATATRRLR
jgi:hypothetical protein